MSRSNLSKLAGSISAVACACAVLTGCQGGDAPDHPVPQTKAEQDKQRQDQINAIQNNPNIPPDQKAIALGAFSTNRGNKKG